MQYETVIGLEVHVQLDTRSKMFCSCPADYQTAEPNTRTCPVCLGLPGALPVINRRAVEYTMMTGLALHCSIPEFTKFDRKNYPYPDLMKGYQISQYDLPLALDGYLEIDGDPDLATRPDDAIGVERVHLEEDVAKMQHFPDGDGGEGYSLVDVNRSGVPLMEVVSRPDLRSPEEARQYLTTLHSLVQFLGVSTANMQDGNFRCDANVSIRPIGSDTFGTRTEIKNMNSFRSVYDALEYEVKRQRRVIEDGGHVVQETRGWVEEREVTVSQRSKEYAHDYRYFPEPDLPPLNIGRDWVGNLEAALPELAPRRKARFMSDLALSEYDADLLTGSRATADYFETTLSELDPDRSPERCQRNRQLDPRRPLPPAQPGPPRHRRLSRHRIRLVRPARSDFRRYPLHLPRQNRPGRDVRHRCRRLIQRRRHRRRKRASPRSATPAPSKPPSPKPSPPTPRPSLTTSMARKTPPASSWARSCASPERPGPTRPCSPVGPGRRWKPRKS